MEEEKKNQELLKSPQPPRLGLSLKERRKRLQSRRRASLNNAKETSSDKTNSKEQVRTGQMQFSSSVPQDTISTTSNKNEKQQISFHSDAMQSSSIESSRPTYRDVPSHPLMGQSIIESSILPPAATANHSQDNTSSSRFSKEEESMKSSSSASRFSNSMQDMNQVLHPVSSLSAQELKSPTGNYLQESMKKVKTPSLFSKVMQRTPKKINPPEVQMDSSSIELQNGFLSLVNVEKAIKNSQSLTNDAKNEAVDSTTKEENGSMDLCLFQNNGKKGALSLKPSLAPRRNNMFKQWSKSSKQKQSLPVNNTAAPSNSSPSRNKSFASSLMYNDNNVTSQMYSSPSRKRPRPNSSPPRSGSTTQIFSSPEKSALKSSPAKNGYGTPSRLNFSKHSGHVAWDPSTTPSRKKGNLFSNSSPDRNGNPMATPQRKRNSDKLHSVHFDPKTPDTNRKTPMTPSRYYASPGGFALQRFLEGCMSPHQKHLNHKMSDENEDLRVEPAHGYDDREDSRGSVGSLGEFADGWNECWLHPPLCSDGKNRDVGLLDWSIKSQIKFECYPKNCILGTAFHNPGDWDSILKDDLIEKRAMDMFLMKSTSDVSDMNKEDIALAQWKASLMYWQHPATHPLPPQPTSKRNMDVYGMDPIPPSLKRSSSITMRSNNSGESSRMNRSNSNLSFLPTASYSNLTTPFESSFPDVSKVEKAENLVDSVRGKNAPLKNGYTRLSQGSLGGLGSEVFGEKYSSSLSDLMQERKFEWQECFRNLFLQWIKEVKMMQHPCDPCSASRVSFYSVEKKSTVLFRPFVDGKTFKPMILLSSSTLRFRDTLRAVGVEFKVKSEALSPESFQEFNENLLNEWVLSDIEQGEETSKVHEELEALRRVTANGGSLGAEVSISMRKRPRKSKSLSLFPPLIIEGFENCMAFYEVYLNSYGMSGEQNNSSQECDVPLLLSRGAIGQNARMTLRTLKVSKNNLNSTVDGNNEGDEEGQVSTMNIHGPILPDSFRDLVYASTSYSTLHQNLSKPLSVDANENTESEDNSLGSHYIMIQLTDHAIDKFREKSTTRQHMEVGTRGSLFFNGTSSLSIEAGENNESPNEIVQNEVTTIAVWGINRPTKLAYRSSLVEEVAPDS
ncbi:hypothetical protein CTEN210_04523 [Chaetoceros tenuissimus]|uniref:Uncharacterized protein n=1 Tax=Chaetoceros tenuissimus TaxID=426638 RepID=A0AAD3H2C9_9STRA|nr:hypothetical protein CTEN210_04523 [Chaetoceros tenuissimus]